MKRRSTHLGAILLAALCVPAGVGVAPVGVRPAIAGESSGLGAAELVGQINAQVEKRWREKGLASAQLCDDRTFVRRVYLDLAGRIPSPSEADAFQSDPSPDRRARLVDRLLASPDYALRMRDVFDVVLMGRQAERPRRRRGEGGGGNFRAEWLNYLKQAFAENRPWDRMLREMLVARPSDPTNQGAVWFLYARQDRYQEIAETVSPAMFGVQIQCAQCHDHPLADEIKQSHYWGLVAFFNRSKPQNTKQGPRVAESAIGGFSRFANLSGESQPNFLSFLGAPPVEEMRPPDGAKEEDKPELYQPLPAGVPADEPRVPKFSRREQFVERVVKGNTLVARAAANRLWALTMGRGLVHPVDKMDSKHPASHPELLDYLAKDFEASGFDVKRMVRALVLSRPYQLAAVPVPNALPEHFAQGLEKPLTAEQLFRSLLVAATGKTDGDHPELRDALVNAFPDVFPEENIATLKQTMFLSNNPLVQQLVRPGGGNTAERLAAMPDPVGRVREAFRIAYNREPDAEELKETTAFLQARTANPQKATSQLWWALLAGAEFRINH